MLLRLKHKDESNFTCAKFFLRKKPGVVCAKIACAILFRMAVRDTFYCLLVSWDFAGPDIPPPRTRASPGWRYILFTFFRRPNGGKAFEKTFMEKRTYQFIYHSGVFLKMRQIVAPGII
jgi:hypothetical protein